MLALTCRWWCECRCSRLCYAAWLFSAEKKLTEEEFASAQTSHQEDNNIPIIRMGLKLMQEDTETNPGERRMISENLNVILQSLW